MKFSNISRDLNIERKDCLYLSLLTIYAIAITVILINFNESIGIYCSDVYIYLYNSLIFAGMADNTYFLYLSPVICFLTSILFRLGFLSETSLYAVTGLFSILSSLGIYLLLKRYFNSLLSLAGGVLFTSFSLNLLWWANGTLDIPAIALSIFAVLFLIIAVDENPKYFMLAFPILALGIFTRYTCLFLIPLFLLYYLLKHDFFYSLMLFIFDRKDAISGLKSYLKSDEFKYIVISLVLALLLSIAIVWLIRHFGGHLSFLRQSSSLASGSKGSVIDNAYTTDTLFYLHDFLNFLFSQKVVFTDTFIPVLTGAGFMSYLLVLVLVLGLSISVYRLFNRNNDEGGGDDDGDESKHALDSHGSKTCSICRTSRYRNALMVLFALSLVLSVIGFKINSLISISFLLVALVALSSLLKNSGFDKSYYVPIFMIAWFLAYFIFFSFLNIKVNRYIITVFPAFIYFLIYALNEILEILDGKSFGIVGFGLSNLIPIVLIVLCLFSAFSFTGTFEENLDFHDYEEVADYLIDYDGDYASKDIATYKQRPFNWWLKTNTIPVMSNQTDVLESSNISYYICDEDLKFENYTKIYSHKDIFLYERID